MRRKEGRKKRVWVSLIGLLCIVVGLWIMVDRYMPNFEMIPAFKLIPGFQEDQIALIWKDQPMVVEYPPKVMDGEILLPIDFVQAYIDPYIFWDAQAHKLTITTQNKVIRMKNEELTYYVNDEPFSINIPVQIVEGVPYIPIALFENIYHIDVVYREEEKVVTIDERKDIKTVGKVLAEQADLRHEADIKSPILEKIKQSEEVMIYEQIDGWVKVRSASGLLGYVQTKEIIDIREIAPEVVEQPDPMPIWKPTQGKLNLVWEQVFKVEQNTAPHRLQPVKGLDVLSPTWFSIANEEGDIKNIADKRYVDWAHSQGYQVWALVDNQFSPKLTHAVLSSTDTREKIIKQLLALAALYDLDGINIDFESVAKEDGPLFVQFMRELTPYLKQQGLVVSVDMYVPSEWTKHYNRTEVGAIVDYVMVMAYDEHWGTSPNSGSVASIGWVERGIQKTLQEVPAEKVVLGLPYYTRLWKEVEQDGQIKVTSKAYGMSEAARILKENTTKIEWDEEIGQYYGEYMKDDVMYKLWLEEERSIEKKVALVEKYNLAGVAGWKRGLEKPEVWDTLYEYLKK